MIISPISTLYSTTRSGIIYRDLLSERSIKLSFNSIYDVYSPAYTDLVFSKTLGILIRDSIGTDSDDATARVYHFAALIHHLAPEINWDLEEQILEEYEWVLLTRNWARQKSFLIATDGAGNSDDEVLNRDLEVPLLKRTIKRKLREWYQSLAN